MEAAKLGCIGFPLPPCPSRSSSRGTSGSRVFCALESPPLPTSSLSCNRPPSPSTFSPQLSLLSVVGTLANFVCLPVLAAEEVLESSSSAAATTASNSTQVAESVGASVGSAVQSSVESAGAAASKAIVADAGDSDLVINILGSGAFVALSLLSIGIVYLAVTDFLEKKKSDEEAKRLNEEAAAAAKKKRPGSLTAAGKGGAKGFGQKRQEDE
eukprot:c15949_g1_i1 orf=56-694(+)